MNEVQMLLAALRAALPAANPDPGLGEVDQVAVAARVALQALRVLAAATAASGVDAVVMPLERGQIRAVLNGMARLLDLTAEVAGHLAPGSARSWTCTGLPPGTMIRWRNPLTKPR